MAGSPGGTGIYGSTPGVVNPGLDPRGMMARGAHAMVPASQGGRSNAARLAAQAATHAKAASVAAAKAKVAAKTTGSNHITATPTPPAAPTLTPPNDPLSGNYDPNQLNSLPMSDTLQTAAGKIQLPNALNYANSMAGLQYGPQINAVADRIKGLTQALPDSLAALDKAFANLDAQKAVQVVNAQTSGQGVANLFGGATNAAGVAANQSAQASATAANQAGSLTDQNNAASTREADWKTRIQLLNNMAVNQAQTDKAGLEGQFGNARKAYYDQGLKTRGDMISQAVSNQGALNNQKITAAMAGGYLENLGLKNQAQALTNSLTGTQAAAAPYEAANAILQGKQNILTTISTRGVNVASARAALAKAPGGPPTTLKGALSKGLDGAVQAMVLPATAISQNSTTGQYVFNGDPNSYFNAGVAKLQNTFKDADPKQLRQYVANQINVALQGAGRPWVYKGSPNGKGKFVKAKAKK